MSFFPTGIFLFLLVSCASKGLGPDYGDLSRRTAVSVSHERNSLFPYGLYFHRITITDPRGKKREFKGILNLQEKVISIVGLSRLGTTFFKLTEDLNSKAVSYKFYHPMPEAFQKKFLLSYHFMKKVFVMPLKESPDEKNKIIWNKSGFPESYADLEQEAQIVFSRYDQNMIPRALDLKQKEFSASIVLENYQVIKH